MYETQMLTRIEWAATCTDGNSIPPGKSYTLPLKEGSFQPSGEANVFWWYRGKTLPNTSNCQPDKIERIIVKVK